MTTTATLAVTKFLYDGDGQRVMKIAPNGQSTIYIGALFEKNVSTGVTTTYYFAGSMRIAVRQGGVLSYLAGDHLGSTSLTLDASGNKIGEMKYYPYGETRYSWGSVPTDRRFTGQRQDSYINLYEMGARWYDPALGRWIQPDTIVPDSSNPQSLSRYSYVSNRPLNLADPSGHCPKDDKLCEAIVKNIKDTFGVIMQDDTAIWQGQEARLVEDVLKDIANGFMRVSNISWDAATALVKKTWGDVVLNRMHSTNNPFGGDIAWTVPMFNGKLLEIPDASSGNGLWNWSGDIQWTGWVIAHELGHSWDFRDTNFSKYLGGYNGGRLSEGLVKAVGADASSWCLGLFFCAGYDAGREDPVGGRNWGGARSPVEDWGSSFAQFVEPRNGMQLRPMRAQYVANQMALMVQK